MGLFDIFKSKKQNNNSTPPTPNTTKPKGGFDNLPLYEHISGIDCFDIHSKRYNDLQIKIGDHLQVLFMPSAISNAIDAVVCFENKKLGYLPHNIGKWLRLFYSKNDNECIVDNVILGDKNELFVKINLPYKNIDKNLPLKTNLVGVTFDNRQNALNQSIIGDVVTIKHEPTAEYPNILKVYNQKLNQCVGVIPDDTATKYVKKYKQGCMFSGVIYSLYGGNYTQNIGVDIVILDNIKEV